LFGLPLFPAALFIGWGVLDCGSGLDRRARRSLEMLAAPLVIFASFAYLLLLFAVAWVGDRRSQQGRSIIG